MQVLERIMTGVQEFGFCSKGWIESPIKGAEGNIEFLVCFQRVPGKATRYLNFLPVKVLDVAAGEDYTIWKDDVCPPSRQDPPCTNVEIADEFTMIVSCAKLSIWLFFYCLMYDRNLWQKLHY